VRINPPSRHGDHPAAPPLARIASPPLLMFSHLLI